MYIDKLQLKNYRNYKSLELYFDKHINVIIGENAQGKTNILEAIYMLAFTKSFRTSNDKELIKFGEEFAKVTAKLIKNNEKRIPLELIYHQQGKKVKVNHLEKQRISQYVGTMNVVIFAPEDLMLIKGAPQQRRKFIDMELGQIEPMYVYHLSKYQKVLKQRNQYLKQINFKASETAFLDVLTDQLIEHSVYIFKKRFFFLKLLKQWAIPIHKKISRGLEDLNITYESKVNIIEDDNDEVIKEKLIQAFKKQEKNELYRGTTLVGPHRDDLNFYINDKEVKLYGSQGQQRTTALSLKLAEIDLIHDQINDYPILLLDDVLSELDDHRQSHLLSAIQGKVQTFVTTTTVDGIEHETLKQASIFPIEAGQIKESKDEP